MTISMVPCPGCSRHVYTADRACPFCGEAPVPAHVPTAAPEPSRGASRFAILALGATLGLGACGPQPLPAYGGPPLDAARSDVQSTDGADAAAADATAASDGAGSDDGGATD